MKFTKYILISILFFSLTISCLAQTDTGVKSSITNQLTEAGVGSGSYDASTDEYTMSKIIGIGVKAFLSILGIIFIILVLYGGFTYMNARGDESKIEKAIATIRHAIIGLVITVASYAVYAFIFDNFFSTT